MKNQKNTGTIAEQLSHAGVVKSAILPRHPGSWKEDGVDHINVSQGAKTVIGKWLNGRNGIAFHHPVLGQFSTIENLMFFVKAQSPDDRIRTEYDFNIVRRLLAEGGGTRRNMQYADAIHIEAIYLRILMNESLIKKMITSDLPFDSYFVSRETGLRQRFEPARYLCAGYEEIRKALKERRALDLRQFTKTPSRIKMEDVDIYKELMERLAPDYKGNARQIIEAFTEQRWQAYDHWVSIKPSGNGKSPKSGKPVKGEGKSKGPRQSFDNNQGEVSSPQEEIAELPIASQEVAKAAEEPLKPIPLVRVGPRYSSLEHQPIVATVEVSAIDPSVTEDLSSFDVELAATVADSLSETLDQIDQGAPVVEEAAEEKQSEDNEAEPSLNELVDVANQDLDKLNAASELEAVAEVKEPISIQGFFRQ